MTKSLEQTNLGLIILVVHIQCVLIHYISLVGLSTHHTSCLREHQGFHKVVRSICGL